MIRVSYQAVPARHHMSAMRFLTGGAAKDPTTELQARSLYERTLGSDPASAALWWARRWRKPLAAVMIYRNVGRTGLVFASPVTGGADIPVLVELVRVVTQQEIEHGLSMVQSLLPTDAHVEADVLRQAGYHPLAELIYMELNITPTPRNGLPFRKSQPSNAPGLSPHESHPEDLPKSQTEGETPSGRMGETPMPHAGETPARREGETPSPQHDAPRITLRDYDEFTPIELENVITRTYEHSMDCPALAGVRNIGDVIIGHRATGLFNPHTWWIASVDGQPAGCILLNDCHNPEQAEVVYLGVVPEFRGRGVAKSLLSHAIDESHARDIKTLSLAVDAANIAAKALYKKAGFVATHRRQAMIFTWKDTQPKTPGKTPC